LITIAVDLFGGIEMNLLKVESLHVHFPVEQGIVKAVNGINFSINNGETLAIVGESGCGKSTTAHAIMRLISSPGYIAQGQIFFNNVDLATKSERYLESIRGKDMAMIFQEPMTSLNPVLRVGEQIAETIRIHTGANRKEAWMKAIEMMDHVGISTPERRAEQYPHQMSGGMRQRAMIAMALACEPKLLIADEPTTALDVTIQAQILRLMRKLQKEFDTAILFITHDLGVVAEMADRVAVMYLGLLVEEAPVEDIFHRPLHPYTQGLLRSVPDVTKKTERLHQIDGNVPTLSNMPDGCPFHPRCAKASDICKRTLPQLQTINTSRVACFHAEKSCEGVK